MKKVVLSLVAFTTLSTSVFGENIEISPYFLGFGFEKSSPVVLIENILWHEDDYAKNIYSNILISQKHKELKVINGIYTTTYAVKGAIGVIKSDEKSTKEYIEGIFSHSPTIAVINSYGLSYGDEFKRVNFKVDIPMSNYWLSFDVSRSKNENDFDTNFRALYTFSF